MIMANYMTPVDWLTSQTLVPGGKGSLIVAISSQWSDTNRLPTYFIVVYTNEGRQFGSSLYC
jgi:hypothetical protein